MGIQLAFVNLSKNIITMIALKVLATFCLATFCLVSAATLTEKDSAIEGKELENLKQGEVKIQAGKCGSLNSIGKAAIEGKELENLKQDEVKIQAGKCGFYCGCDGCIPSYWECDGECDCDDCSDESYYCYSKGLLDERYLTRFNRKGEKTPVQGEKTPVHY